MCTAVAFGIGLGLKVGVGKATEFFPGYAEFCIVDAFHQVHNRSANVC